MDTYQPRHLGHLIRRSQQIHTKMWRQEVSDEVTSPQLSMLRALERRPDVDQRTLGGLISLDRSSTAEVVERMLARGYVARSRDPADRRRNLLRITPSGKDLLQELSPRAVKLNEMLLGMLAPNDADQLVRLLSAFVEADVDQDGL